MRQRKWRQRGDTLVEVLICILIVSVILTGAYVTTNRSSLRVRDSQEQAEALKLVQSQLEQIRQNAENGGQVFTQSESSQFCMAGTQPEPVVATDARCQLDGAAQPSTTQPAYRLAVSRADCTAGPNCHRFTISASWDSVSAGTRSKQQISYRLHRQ